MSEIYSNIYSVIDSIAQNNDEESYAKLIKIKDSISMLLDGSKSLFSTKVEEASHLEAFRNSKIDKVYSIFIDSFGSIPKSISNIRSTYLPVEILNSYYTSSLGSGNEFGDATQIYDDISKKESYENAFMRVLGLPEFSDIPEDSLLYIIKPNALGGLKLEKVPLSSLFSGQSQAGLDIFDERQREIGDPLTGGSRVVSFSGYEIGNYTFSSDSFSDGSSDTTNDMLYLEDIANDPSNLFDFIYLKCLPLQDSRISSCINESEKIVLKPFSNDMKINSVDGKRSFLENIIRLRLDKLTGQIWDVEENSINVNDELRAGEFSILEQFIFERLLSLLFSFAKNYNKNIKIVKENYETSKEKADISSGNKSFDSKKNIERFRDIIDAQEAILFLLKDTSASSFLESNRDKSKGEDFYKGLIKTSSGYDDIISQAIISIINSETNEYRKELQSISSSVSSNSNDNESKIDSHSAKIIMGDKTNPIGIIDVLIYSIALFSMNESDLINLLNEKQKAALAKELGFEKKSISWTKSMSATQIMYETYGLIEGNISDAVNNLTLSVYAYYNIFIQSIGESYDAELQDQSNLIASEAERMSDSMDLSGEISEEEKI